MNLFKIGEFVFSGQFGVGEVVSIETMGDQNFYAIQSIETTVKVFVAINANTSLRALATKDQVEALLKSLGKDAQVREFPTKKDRINFFKEEVKTCIPQKQYDLLNEMFSIGDRGKSEDSALSKHLETLALEIKYLYKIELDASKEMLETHLKGE